MLYKIIFYYYLGIKFANDVKKSQKIELIKNDCWISKSPINIIMNLNKPWWI